MNIPKIVKNPLVSALVAVRVTEEEKAFLKTAAESHGISISSLLRYLIMDLRKNTQVIPAAADPVINNKGGGHMKVIHKDGGYRIIEVIDHSYNLEDLKGDCFKPEVNHNITRTELLNLEQDFERRVESQGVYGYILEQWIPFVGHGWDHVDSCYGFVGTYNPSIPIQDHYIISEFKRSMEGKGDV